MRLLHFTHADENERPNEYIILTTDEDPAQEFCRTGFELRFEGEVLFTHTQGKELLPLDQVLVKEL
jgi:hypothetical protein